MKLDKFVIAIIITIGVAYLFPRWGMETGPIPLDMIASIGVSLIFFFYGLKLSREKIASGISNWRLHLLVQAGTFLVFPLLVLMCYPLVRGSESFTTWLAFLFLAAVPSTVSSSVVMVSMARGNIPAAIFNASISGLIGIVVTPLWMGLFIQQAGSGYDFSSIYLQLVAEILLPLIAGILLQRYGHRLAMKYAKALNFFDKAIILLIIYKSFSHSFAENAFSVLQAKDLFVIAAGVLILFYLVYFLTGWTARLMHFNREDTITAQFCGTKKSLVHGTVFSKILFGPAISSGLVLLPLMLFHAVQIFIISIIASKKEKEAIQLPFNG